jgi:hypothetical protein
MSVIHNDRVFAAAEATASPVAPNLFHSRTPLNVGAAQIAANLRRRVITPGLLSALARVADCVFLTLASAVVLWIYVAPDEGIGARYVLASLVLPLVTTVAIGSFRGYTIAAYRHVIADVGRVAGVWTAVFGCFTLLLFFMKMGEDFSRVWLGSWFLSGLVGLALLRTAVSRLVVHWTVAGVLERRAVLVGGGTGSGGTDPRAPQ